MTLREVSRRSGVSPAVLSRANRGARLSQHNMRKLVRFTRGQVSYDDLIRRADRAEASG